MLTEEYQTLKGVIPTIGVISSGKSTFLNALLGIDVLETDVATVTEFILFIKHNPEKKYLLQKISLKEGEKNSVMYKKEGEIISGERDIKEKIKALNKEFNNKNVETKELLYMLEIPILAIDNQFLLNNYCFIDLPGLNEANSTDKFLNIFEMLSPNLIKFEIFIIDSTSFEGNAFKSIISKINEKKGLKKEQNLFILNKLDKSAKEKRQEKIDDFSFYFYNNFGDGFIKSEGEGENSKFYIDIYKNTLIPFNSLLYNSENLLSIGINFSALLEKELFSYLDDFRNNYKSFYEYLEVKLSDLLNKGNNKDSGCFIPSVEEEKESIVQAYENVQNLIEKINPEKFQFEIDIHNDDHFDVLKNIFFMYTNNKWSFNYSKTFYEIKTFFNNIAKKEDIDERIKDNSIK